MLRTWMCGAALIGLAASFGPANNVAAGDSAIDKRIESLSTEALIALVDETDFTDPIEANHRTAIQAIEVLLGRDLTEEQQAAAHFRLAVYHLRTDAREQALKEVDSALRLDPDNTEYMLMKGSLLFDAGKNGDGKSYARRALAINTDLLDAQQCYSRLAGRAHLAEDDRMLLKKCEPMLSMIMHPYLKGATTFFKADDYRAALSRVDDYLKVAPFDFQYCDNAFVIYVVSSSRMPLGNGEGHLPVQELVRRGIQAWNMASSPPHRTEILKSLVRAVHYAYDGKSPGTVLALSESLVGAQGLEQKDLAGAHYVRAKAFGTLGRYTEAIGEIDLALRSEPRDAESRALRVEYLTWLGQYAAALKECDVILANNPSHVSTLLLKAQIHAGCPDAKYRDAKTAMKLASQACSVAREKQRSDLFSPYKMLVLASAEAGDMQSANEAVKQLRFAADTVEAVQAVQRLSDQLRDHKPFKLETSADNSKLPRPKLLYQQLALSQPNFQIVELQTKYEQMCDELLATKELTDAERVYCLRRRALCRFWQGKLDTAITDIDEQLAKAPTDFSMFVLLNRACLEKNDQKAAAATWERLQKAGDGSQDFRWISDVVRVETDLYRIDHETFETPQLREDLVAKTGTLIDRMIAQSPQQPVLYQFRAASRFQRGDYRGALEDSQRCLDMAPYRSRDEFANILHQHVRILEKLYQLDAALHFASMALHVDGGTGRTRRLVGGLYKTLGKHQLASHWAPEATPAKVQPAVAEKATEPPR